jgi:hypothetical protein
MYCSGARYYCLNSLHESFAKTCDPIRREEVTLNEALLSWLNHFPSMSGENRYLKESNPSTFGFEYYVVSMRYNSKIQVKGL